MIVEGKQKIWADYQKDIPDDHYFYVRSCIRQSFFPGSEVTFLDITRNKLGKDFYESAYHTTCGGIAYHSDSIPQETAMTIIARQFALMHESGRINVNCEGYECGGRYSVYAYNGKANHSLYEGKSAKQAAIAMVNALTMIRLMRM